MRTVMIQVEEVRRETDLALLFVVDGEEVWVPKSQIEESDEISEGDEDIEVNVAEWFAEQEGLV
jgi:hypothetical protein